MRRLALGFAPLLLVGCRGLFLDQPNAWPCDFSQPAEVRNAPCATGDVCGIDGRCHAFVDEGPQFQGGLALPVYGPGTSAAAVISPVWLKGPIASVTREPSLDGTTYVAQVDGGWFTIDADNTLRLRTLELPDRALEFWPTWRRGALSNHGALVRVTNVAGDAQRLLSTFNPVMPGGGLVQGFGPASRVETVAAPRGTTAVVWSPDSTSVSVVTSELTVRTEDAPALPRAVNGLLFPGDLVHPLVATDTALVTWAGDAGVELAALSSLDATSTGAVQLRTDLGGGLVALVRGRVLSLYQFTYGTGPALTSVWPECTPCAQGTIGRVAPSNASGEVHVELTCEVGEGSARVVRPLSVTGSVARSSSDGCVVEAVQPPVAFARLRDTAAWDSTAGLVWGGAAGEVWSGGSISSLLPAFLDRVPLDVGVVTNADGDALLVALTDDYAAREAPPAPDGGLANGLQRSLFGLTSDTKLIALVHGTNSWALTTEGNLARLANGGGPAYGPTLVQSNGAPISQSAGGELLPGGVFYVAAHDSVYVASVANDALSALPSADLAVPPNLTPEPNVTIRSFALDRSPGNTDGAERAHGYLVTSRNLYDWRVEGSPARWTATPLPLSSGVPVETWFDAPSSALGRVGFDDGTVFTLPGGYQLTEQLPGGEDRVAVTATDYENLGGWPVVYASTGLFIAQWDLDAAGALVKGYPDGGVARPMTWRRVTLPDGSEPWLRAGRARAGRLFVRPGNPQRLLLFLDEQVLQVAELTAPSP